MALLKIICDKKISYINVAEILEIDDIKISKRDLVASIFYKNSKNVSRVLYTFDGDEMPQSVVDQFFTFLDLLVRITNDYIKNRALTHIYIEFNPILDIQPPLSKIDLNNHISLIKKSLNDN